MKFSIVVPTYNEENDLKNTLESLIALDYPDYEVFMVDDSTDSTPDIIQCYASRGVRLIKPGGGGRCEARNKGVELATGDVLVILNADVHLSKNFLHEIKKHYDQGADLVSVNSKVINDDRLFARYVDCCGLLFVSNPQRNKLLWTEGFSCRRELALKAGLFPTGFPIALYGGEDGYFAENLIKSGGKWCLDLNVVVHHIAPANFKEYWSVRKKRGQACPQIRRYINRWSMRKVIGWHALKTGFNFLKIITLIIPLHYCWKLTRYSKYGKKDWLPLYYTYLLETVAMTFGFWQEIFCIYKKEKKISQDSKNLLQSAK